MPSSPVDTLLPFRQITKVIMVLDVVESVRLMEQDEHGFIQRWHRFVQEATQNILPPLGGRMHKSLGDGLMLEFSNAAQSIRAAEQLQALCTHINAGLPENQRMMLRVGAHMAQFVADQYDIYGADVNLTARITTLAGPGEIVVTSRLRDHLTHGLDADLEDLGECHLKHVKEPVRAFRVGQAGPAPVLPPSAEHDMRPTVAVIPFDTRYSTPEHFVIGELIADGVIAQLSRTAALRVISRLSTSPFRGRSSALLEVQSHLAASFVLSGNYVTSDKRILIMAELADARTHAVIWTERLSGDTDDLLQIESELLNALATSTARAVIDTQTERSLVQPMPHLDSSALLLGGISMMHRASVREFERSRQVLDVLVERHARIAAPRAWLAKWHVMKVIRGLSDSPRKDTQLALEQTKRALDSEPENALTLAVEGYAHCQLLSDVDLANERLAHAFRANPNEPMAWLFKSVVSSMWGSTTDAVMEAEFARALSPIDPLAYFFDLLTASALLADNAHERAIEFAGKSLHVNRHHSPTLRVLLTAQTELGLIEQARKTLGALLREEPELTVSAYLAMGSSSSLTRQRCANALRRLGLKET